MKNSDSTPLANCAAWEELMLESIDGACPQADRERLNAHLTGCAGCREFLNGQRELDAMLSVALRRPALPGSFREQMIEHARATLTGQEPGALPSERWDALQRWLVRDAAWRLLDGLGYAALFLIAGVLISAEVMPRFHTWALKLQVSPAAPELMVAATLLSLGVGCATWWHWREHGQLRFS